MEKWSALKKDDKIYLPIIWILSIAIPLVVASINI